MSSDKYVTIGKLGRTRGLKGELCVTPLTDFPERFVDLSEIYVKLSSGWEKFRVVSTRVAGGRPAIRLAGIDSPEEAARYTNREIGVPIDQVFELPEDTFYIFDLIGCKVFEEGTDRLVGEIVNVEQYPGNDAYVIQTVAEREVLFPAVKEFVKDVDVTNRRIVIATAGILDE